MTRKAIIECDLTFQMYCDAGLAPATPPSTKGKFPLRTSFVSGLAFSYPFKLKPFFWALLCLLLGLPVRAQQPSQPAFHGILRNTAGAPISRARIQLAAASAHAEAQTAADGPVPLAPPAAGKDHLYTT